MEKDKASAEELDKAQANDEVEEVSEETEDKVDESANDSEEEGNDSEDDSEEEKEPTIPLNKYTSAKDTLNRLTDKYIGDEDALEELAEEDPKLLERLKKEFPKKFKNVKIPTKIVSDEDVEVKVQSAVKEAVTQVKREAQLDSFRRELGLSKIEFSDIEEDIIEKANKYEENEVADSYEEALTLALKAVKPSMAKELLAVRGAKRKVSSMDSGKSAKKSPKSEFEKLEDQFAAKMPKGWKA